MTELPPVAVAHGDRRNRTISSYFSLEDGFSASRVRGVARNRTAWKVVAALVGVAAVVSACFLSYRAGQSSVHVAPSSQDDPASHATTDATMDAALRQRIRGALLRSTEFELTGENLFGQDMDAYARQLWHGFQEMGHASFGQDTLKLSNATLVDGPGVVVRGDSMLWGSLVQWFVQLRHRSLKLTLRIETLSRDPTTTAVEMLDRTAPRWRAVFPDRDAFLSNDVFFVASSDAGAYEPLGSLAYRNRTIQLGKGLNIFTSVQTSAIAPLNNLMKAAGVATHERMGFSGTVMPEWTVGTTEPLPSTIAVDAIIQLVNITVSTSTAGLTAAAEAVLSFPGQPGAARLPIVGALHASTFTLAGRTPTLVLGAGPGATVLTECHLDITVQQLAGLLGRIATHRATGTLRAVASLAGEASRATLALPVPRTQPQTVVLQLQDLRYAAGMRLEHMTMRLGLPMGTSAPQLAGRIVLPARGSENDTLIIDVVGTVSHAEAQLTGALREWSLPLGTQSLSLKDVTATVRVSVLAGASALTGRLVARAELGRYRFAAELMLPGPAHSGPLFALTGFQEPLGGHTSTGDFLGDVAGADAVQGLDAPEATKAVAMQAHMTNVAALVQLSGPTLYVSVAQAHVLGDNTASVAMVVQRQNQTAVAAGSPTWGVAVVLSTHAASADGLALSSFSPAPTAFDGLGITNITIAFSNMHSTVYAPPSSLPADFSWLHEDLTAAGVPRSWLAVRVQPEVRMSCTLSASALAHKWPALAALSSAKIRLVSTFHSGTTRSAFTARAVLLHRVPVASGMHASLRAAFSAVGSALTVETDGMLWIQQHGDAGNEIECHVRGVLEGRMVALSGSAANWNLRGLLPGMHVTNTQLGVKMEWPRAQLALPVLSGNLTGTVQFLTWQLQARLALPFDGAVSVSVPTLHVADGLELHNLQLSQGAGHVKMAGQAEMQLLPHHPPARLAVEGAWSKDRITLHAVVSEVTLGKRGLVLHNAVLDVAVEPTGEVSGGLTADVVLGGITMQAAFALPHEAQFTVPIVELASGLSLHNASVHVGEPGETGNAFGLAGVLVAATGVRSQDHLTLSVEAHGDRRSAEFTATLDMWQVGSLTMRDLDLHLSTSASPNGTAAVAGRLHGVLELLGVRVEAEVLLPVGGIGLDVSFPDLRLSSHVSLRNAHLLLQPLYNKYDVTAQARIDLGPHMDMLQVDMAGHLNAAGMHLSAAVPTWQLHVGHWGMNFTDSAVSLLLPSESRGGKSAFVGWLNGTVALGQHLLHASARLAPKGSGLDFTLHYLQQPVESGLAVQDVVQRLASPGESLDAPPSVVSELMSAHMRDLSLRVRTSPPLFYVHGQSDLFARNAVACGLQVARINGSAPWGVAMGVALDGVFSFSQVLPAVSRWDFLTLSDACIVGYSSEMPIIMPEWCTNALPGARPGVSFAAKLELDHSKQELKALELWGEVGVLIVEAYFTRGTATSFHMEAKLPVDLRVGTIATLNGSLIIQSGKPQFMVAAAALVHLGGDLPPLTCNASLALSSDSTFRLEGAADAYRIPVGAHGITMSDVMASIVIKRTAGTEDPPVQATIQGRVQLGRSTGMMGRVTLPTAHGVQIELTADSNVGLALNETVKALTGVLPARMLTMPADLLPLLGSPFARGQVVITTAPLSFLVRGQLSAFQVPELVDVEFLVDRDPDTDRWDLHMGVGIGGQFTMRQVFPSLPQVGHNPLMANGALALSTAVRPYTFKYHNVSLTVLNGIKLAGSAVLDGPLKLVQDWTRVQDLMLVADVGFETLHFRMAGEMHMHWNLGDGLNFHRAALFMDVGGPHGITVGMDCSVDMALRYLMAEDTAVTYFGSIEFGVDEALMDLATTTDWEEPLGLRGVTLLKSQLRMGLLYTGEPATIGVSGGLRIGALEGTGTVYGNVDDVSMVMAGTLKRVSLAGIVEEFAQRPLTSKLERTLTDFQLNDVYLNINLGTRALYFNGELFRAGIYARVRSFSLLGTLRGSANFMLGQASGVFLNGTLEPIELANGDFVLSGFESDSSPSQILADLRGNALTDRISINGRVKLLKSSYYAATATISDTFLDVGVSMQLGHSNMSTHVTAGLDASRSLPVDLKLDADLDAHGVRELEGQIVDLVHQWRDALGGKLSEARRNVQEWETSMLPELRRMRDEIDRLQQESRGRVTELQARLQDAHLRLEKARARLQSLSREIQRTVDGREQCFFLDAICHARNGVRDAKIAALWTEQHAADAAMFLAERAVDAAKAALEVAKQAAVQVDPR